MTQNTVSVSWTFASVLSLVAAARALEPHLLAWFGHESNLTRETYSLYTDSEEIFHNQTDYAPLLEVIEGRPNNLILNLAGPGDRAAVQTVAIWHTQFAAGGPITVTLKINGSDVPAVARLRDRSRERLTAIVAEVLGADAVAGQDSVSIPAGGTATASSQVAASVFDEVDQSRRLGVPRRARVFLSYSHDSVQHKEWVARLANRLNSLGIWLIFDQWDLELGGDLPRFMESGITEADRVIVVCTGEYNRKANSGNGGAGYEKMIMTADLLRDQTSSRLVPVVRGTHSPATPTFLGSRRYVDFTDDALFEEKLDKLSRALLITGSQRPPYAPPAAHIS